MRETCEFASVLAAESIGVPDVHVACFLAVLDEREFDLYAPLARLRAEFGFPAPRRDRSQRAVPDARAARARAPGLPRVPRHAPLPRARDAAARPLPDWWDGSTDPLVYVSFGSAAAGNGFFPDVYRGAVDALADAAGARAADRRHRGRPGRPRRRARQRPRRAVGAAGRGHGPRVGDGRPRRLGLDPGGDGGRHAARASSRCSPTSPRTPSASPSSAPACASTASPPSPTPSPPCSRTRPTAPTPAPSPPRSPPSPRSTTPSPCSRTSPSGPPPRRLDKGGLTPFR